jgi:hypothetical protein
MGRRSRMSPEEIGQDSMVRGISRLGAVLYALIVLGWLCLVAYVWITQGSWGVGWQLLGTINFTVAAVLAVTVVWLGSRFVRRFAQAPPES